MPIKSFRRVVVPTLLVIVVLTVFGTVLTRYWASAPPQQAAIKAKPSADASLVDEQPLISAQRLAAMATTHEEQEFAQNAVRLADHEVDLAFAAALRNATRHPPAVPVAARPVLARVESLQNQVNDEQKDVARLKALLAKTPDDKKLDLEERLQLSEATLDVDEQELDAAHQELIRLGGDPRNKIQQLMDQHEASGHRTAAPSRTGDASPQGRTLVVQFRAWRQWASKEVDLTSVRGEIQSAETELAGEHHAFQEGAAAKGENRNIAGAQPLSTATAPASSAAAEAGSTSTGSAPAATDRFALLKRAAEQHKHLAELDKRASDLLQLDALYGQWETLVAARKREHQLALIEGACWIAVLLLLVLLANRLARTLVARFASESRRRHTVQLVARLAVQVVGVAMILLVLFGPPSQLATVVALAGAGLTVALKDFIVGFFGWFILMGRNGIHPGDWVEINGIGGEVIEVGLLHTVILETGDWSDAGHPTGRKVTFVNSFAIEGHYFNFSTTGQWLWDEIEVPIPPDVDPYPIAEAVHKAVVAETESNARLAEQEWQRAVPGHVGQTFAPVPAIMVRPTSLGVNVIVRYITRAHERHEQRSRLFYKIVELLRSAQVVSAPLGPEPKAMAAGQ